MILLCYSRRPTIKNNIFHSLRQLATNPRPAERETANTKLTPPSPHTHPGSARIAFGYAGRRIKAALNVINVGSGGAAARWVRLAVPLVVIGCSVCSSEARCYQRGQPGELCEGDPVAAGIKRGGWEGGREGVGISFWKESMNSLLCLSSA